MDSRVLLSLSSENPNEIQKPRSEQNVNVTPLTAHDRTEVSKKAIWEDNIGRSGTWRTRPTDDIITDNSN